jgi:16S rRNA (cytosine967-C5)-methyltransferase
MGGGRVAHVGCRASSETNATDLLQWPAMPIAPARAAAFDILLRVEKTGAYASELLHSSRFAGLSPADHALLTELVMGVLRWRGTLDEVFSARSSQSLEKLDLEVFTALRLGAYQLLFLERIPQYAAINDSVEVVKRVGKRSAAGFVNAVLRKVGQGKRIVVCFDSFVSHPEWLVDRWKKNYGAEVAKKICDYDQATPMPAVRSIDSSTELRLAGAVLEPGKVLARAFRVTAGDITRSKPFRDRRFVIQDEASQLVALLVGHGDSILDSCAAPGGKTRIIAERNPHARIVALELHPRRAALLRKLVRDSNVAVIAADARELPVAQHFDRVLVDAPCSGTGTLARNPEIKWRLKSEDLPRLQRYQLELLLAAMKQVAPGGRLIYSTCSLEPEENKVVIDKALAADNTFRLLDGRDELEKLHDSGELAWQDLDSLLSGPFLRTIPGVHPCDGFFAAILEKR